MAPENIIGKTYNQLTALRYEGGNGKKFRCICSCGKETSVAILNLLYGGVVSCGCARNKPKKHGLRWTPGYRVWCSMRARCTNENTTRFGHYGGRGISVCERWNDPVKFIEDMGQPPKGMTIERKDVNGDYCKENCEWIPKPEQALNKRNTLFITLFDQRIPFHFAARLCPAGYAAFRSRIYTGMDPDEAFSMPKRESRSFDQIEEHGSL